LREARSVGPSIRSSSGKSDEPTPRDRRLWALPVPRSGHPRRRIAPRDVLLPDPGIIRTGPAHRTLRWSRHSPAVVRGGRAHDWHRAGRRRRRTHEVRHHRPTPRPPAACWEASRDGGTGNPTAAGAAPPPHSKTAPEALPHGRRVSGGSHKRVELSRTIFLHSFSRHCERSEATQGPHPPFLGCFVALLLAMTRKIGGRSRPVIASKPKQPRGSTRDSWVASSLRSSQ